MRINERKKRKLKAEEISKASGMSLSDATAKLDGAELLGISSGQYFKGRCWEMTEGELEEYAEVCSLRKEKIEKDRLFYARVAARKSGLPMSQVESEMKAWRKKGISAMRYAQKELWSLSQEEANVARKDIAARNAQSETNAQSFAPKVIEATGWTGGRLTLEIERARVLYGASAADFFQYRMWELTPEENASLITWGQMQKLRAASVSYRSAHRFFDNKVEFNRLFEDAITRRWFSFDPGMPFQEFEDHIDGMTCLFSKPLGGAGGKGVEKFECNVSSASNKSLYELLLARGRQIVEEAIVQHEEMMEICPYSVNTVRMTTIGKNGVCHFILCCLRMGNGQSVDNLHSGGISAEVDVRTGEVISDGVDFYGRRYERHPITKVKIKGFRIPHWEKLLELCRAIYDRVPGVDLVGWDFAITPIGVEVVEGNTGAGYDAIQMPHRLDHRTGLRSQAIDPYLQDEV